MLAPHVDIPCGSQHRHIADHAATGEYEDLVKAGVIDPTKVVRSALQNAASVASLMLATEALIAERPKKKEKAAGAGGHGGEDFGGDY